MGAFFPRRSAVLEDPHVIDQRLRRIEDFLVQMEDPAADAAQEYLFGPTLVPSETTVNSFDGLDDVEAADALTGYIPVFDDGLWTAQDWVHGDFGIGLEDSADTLRDYRVGIRDEPLISYFTGTQFMPGSGGVGWRLDKIDKTVARPHGYTSLVGGEATWAWGQDFDTNNAFNGGTGNSDWVTLYDYNTNAGAGADVIRASAGEMSTLGPLTTKIGFGDGVGNVGGKSELITVHGDVGNTGNLGGMRISFYDAGVTQHALVLINRHATSRRAIINWDDLWYAGSDLPATGATSWYLWNQSVGRTELLVSADGRFQIGGQVLAGSLASISRAAASNPTLRTMLTVTSVADTNLPAGTEASDVVLNLAATKTWATGALATQRAVRIAAPTYAFAGASTLTNPTTFAIGGAPIPGTNATFTRPLAFHVESGGSRFEGNVTLADAANLVAGTTTGSQIGTSASQKLALHGATPVVQDTGWSTTNVTPTRVLDADATTLDQLADFVCTLAQAILGKGIIGA